MQKKFNLKDVFPDKKKSRITAAAAYVIDETMVQIGYTAAYAWLWVTIIEPILHRIIGVYISRHRNMLVAESF